MFAAGPPPVPPAPLLLVVLLLLEVTPPAVPEPVELAFDAEVEEPDDIGIGQPVHGPKPDPSGLQTCPPTHS